MGYLGTKPANSPLTSDLIPDGIITPADLSQGKPVWDTSGNVGIGTSSPAKRLAVQNATDSTTVGTNAVMTVQAGSSVLSVAEIGFGYNGWNGTNPLCTVGYQITSNAGVGLGALTFSTRNVTTDTAPTERMRIDSSGNLLLGSAANPPFAKFLIVQAASDPYARLARFETVNSGTIEAIQFVKNSGGLAQVGSITMTTSATAYNTSSDYRLKENVAPMTGALAKVTALKPVTYTWKESGESSQGFIAHELQEVVPECVTGEKDAVNEDGSIKAQGIDTSFLVATLTAAIQEQQAIITDLRARIEALENV
jgi:hypothetical protein